MPNRHYEMWIDSQGRLVSEITEAGDYFIRACMLDASRGFTLGGRVSSEAGEFSVQLWGMVAGVKTNLGAAVTVAAGTPAAWPDEYSLTGDRGVTVTVTTPGTLVLEIGN